jgi:hypothetical protein
MRYLTFFIFLLILSCSEEEAPKIECQLTKIVVTGPNFESQTVYTYNASGKMDKQVRTNNGAPFFEYTYSYTSNGKVDRVDMGDRYSQFAYTSDGNLSSTTTYLKSGPIVETYSYTWTGNKTEIKFTKPSLPNSFQITTLEFANENLVKRTIKSFTGDEPNVLLSSVETSYEDFDTAFSAFFIASSTRPGYSVEVSKNNPRKQVDITKFYNGETITQESTSTTLFSYTYNSKNATVTSKATTGGTYVVDTAITYDQCN